MSGDLTETDAEMIIRLSEERDDLRERVATAQRLLAQSEAESDQAKAAMKGLMQERDLYKSSNQQFLDETAALMQSAKTVNEWFMSGAPVVEAFTGTLDRLQWVLRGRGFEYAQRPALPAKKR